MADSRPPRGRDNQASSRRSERKGPQGASGRPGRKPNSAPSAQAVDSKRPRGPRPGPIDQSKRGRRDDLREADGPMRLQKLLAHAGVASRRACEELILQGRVTVNGKVERELGTKVDPKRSVVAVDGEKVGIERHVYYAVNKPKGYVSTNDDPSGRPRVIDLLPEVLERVYNVGRLDEDSMGLILLTNDGELANRLSHPKFGVEKVYRVLVAGRPSGEVIDKLVQGIWLAEGKARARRARIVGNHGEATIVEMVLAEGKNREIRRMLAKLGHKVMSLTRVAVGPIALKGLKPGQARPLAAGEVDLLRRVAAGERILPEYAGNRSERDEARGRGRGSKPARERDRGERGSRGGRPGRSRDQGGSARPRIVGDPGSEASPRSGAETGGRPPRPGSKPRPSGPPRREGETLGQGRRRFDRGRQGPSGPARSRPPIGDRLVPPDLEAFESGESAAAPRPFRRSGSAPTPRPIEPPARRIIGLGSPPSTKSDEDGPRRPRPKAKLKRKPKGIPPRRRGSK